MVIFFLISQSHADTAVLISINQPVWTQHHSDSWWVCSPECMALQRQLESLNSKLIANQTSSDLRPVGFQMFLVFKYSVGTLGRTVHVSVVTLIMQGLCDAISKTEEKFKWITGGHPLPPCMPAAREPKLKAGIHARPVDTLTVSWHMFSMYNKATEEGQEGMIQGNRKKERKILWESERAVSPAEPAYSI